LELFWEIWILIDNKKPPGLEEDLIENCITNQWSISMLRLTQFVSCGHTSIHGISGICLASIPLLLLKLILVDYQ
jgi:hypothetical protein